MNYKVTGVVTLAILAIIGGTTLYAEGAMPGSVLYGYKTQINDRIASWFSVEYVTDVNMQIEEVERQLLDIERQVVAGTLTPEKALQVKANLLTQISAAQSTIDTASAKKLTPAQIKQLNDGLNRLKDTLVKYQNTLTTLEDTANKATDEQKRKVTRHINNTRVADVIAAAIESVEVEIAEAIEQLDEAETADLDPEVIEDQIVEDEESVETTEESDQSTEVVEEVGEDIIEFDPAEESSEETVVEEPVTEDTTETTEEEVAL